MSQYNVDHKVVKKPHEDEELSLWEAKELVRCANDVEYFLKTYVYIQNPTYGTMLFEPREYQKRILHEIDNNQFIIGNLPRQCGKSQILAAYLLHQAIFFEDMKVGIASNKLSNAKEIMDRIKYMYENLPWFMKTPIIEYNKQNVRFSNYSSIEAATTTESTFRGKSLNRIMLDEYAHVKPNVAEEFWTALLPTLTAEGTDSGDTKLMIISTPNGTEGQYANLWFEAESDKNGFVPIKVSNDEIPGRGEEFKKQMLQKMSLTKYLQEFEGAFLSDKGTLINSIVLESIKPSDPVKTGEFFRLYTNDLKGKSLAVGIDPGDGAGQDYHAIQVLDVDTLEQVAEFQNNDLSQTLFVKEIINLFKFLYKNGVKDIYYTCERNGVGAGVINLLRNTDDEVLHKAHMISENNKRRGFHMSASTKMEGCADFKDLIETNRMKIHSKQLLSELKFFVKHGESYRAETGKHDDLVMGMVITMLMIKKIARFEDNVYSALYETLNEEGADDEDDQSAPMGIVF